MTWVEFFGGPRDGATMTFTGRPPEQYYIPVTTGFTVADYTTSTYLEEATTLPTVTYRLGPHPRLIGQLAYHFQKPPTMPSGATGSPSGPPPPIRTP